MKDVKLSRVLAAALCICIFSAGAAFAMPALEQTRQMKQPDGSSITAPATAARHLPEAYQRTRHRGRHTSPAHGAAFPDHR